MLYPTLMLALLTVIWGVTFPATKAALAVTTPLQFLALRFGIASVILLPLLSIRMRRGVGASPAAEVRVWRWGVGVGALFLTGFMLQAVGMRYTTASRSGFFTSLLTLFAPLFAALWGTSRASLATWLAIPIAITGVWLLADPAVGGLNKGDILTIGCAAVFALQMMALESASRQQKSAESGGVSRERTTELLTFAQVLVGGVGSLVGALIEGAPLKIESAGWLAVAYTALFGSLVGVWLQTRFQPLVPAGHAALVFTLEPLWAAFFAWILIGEMWTMRGFIGAGLIIIAMAVSGAGMVRRSQ